MLLLLLGCPVPEADSGVFEPGEALPTLSEVEVVCDASGPAWLLDLHTNAWTGGGKLWLSTDGAYVEAHPILSKEAAIDGSADHLELKLTIVSDFRDVAAGSRTAFNCGTPELAGLLIVYGTDAETVGDCRAFGELPERWADWGFSACPDEVSVRASAG